MDPKIAIITICYNSEKYIEDAIKSVVNQNYDNFEYIIIDGGSTDKTLEIVDKYRDKITHVVSEKDEGISDAFNKGILMTDAELIGIVNSDDFLYDNDVLLKVAKHYEPHVDVYRGNEIIRNCISGEEYTLYPTMQVSKIPAKFNICHMAMFVRKSAFEKFGMYDKEYRYAMDKELLFRFMKNGAVCKQIDVTVGVFRLGGVSQTYNSSRRNESIKIAKMLGANPFELLVYRVYLFLKDSVKGVLQKACPKINSKLRFRTGKSK